MYVCLYVCTLCVCMLACIYACTFIYRFARIFFVNNKYQSIRVRQEVGELAT